MSHQIITVFYISLAPSLSSNPFEEVTECVPENDDCGIRYDGRQAFCHQVTRLGVDGVCVPRQQNCERSSDCIKVGNVRTSGEYLAKCNSFNLCEYSTVPVLAQTSSLIKIIMGHIPQHLIFLAVYKQLLSTLTFTFINVLSPLVVYNNTRNAVYNVNKEQ